MLKLKKIIFSLSLLGISLLTMVATTFAWVGITSNSVFDELSIDLKADNDTGTYGVQLSLSGIPGTFSDSIDDISLKRQILKNLGHDSSEIDRADSTKINATFAKFKMAQCTPKKTSAYPEIFRSSSIQSFEDLMAGEYTTRFIYFDVYVSLYIAKATVDPNADTTSINLFLRDNILSSEDIGTCYLPNNYMYPSSQFVINGINYINPFANKELQGVVKVNPASAARVCIQKFEPQPVNYGTPTNPSNYFIYQYDDNIPSYDNSTGIYSFGGILPTEHNMAQQQYKLSHPTVNWPDVPEWQINRGDIQFVDSGEVGKIVNEQDGLTIGKKIKFRVYFWFEGWDSDCFDVVDRRSVSLNLSFSNKGPSDY